MNQCEHGCNGCENCTDCGTDNEENSMAQQAAAETLAQDLADYATSLRSTINIVKLEGRPPPQSMLRAAELFERAAARIAALEAQQARKYRLLQHGEAMCLGDQFIDDDSVSWHPVWKGLVLAGACWSPSYQPMRREIKESNIGPSI